jgi:hypothetical protein
MFLVIRSVASGLQRVETDGQEAKGVVDVVMTAILPFLVIYAAGKLIVEDYFTFVARHFLLRLRCQTRRVVPLALADLG